MKINNVFLATIFLMSSLFTIILSVLFVVLCFYQSSFIYMFLFFGADIFCCILSIVLLVILSMVSCSIEFDKNIFKKASVPPSQSEVIDF